MKKIFLISIFLGLVFSYGFSQTYYYKCVARIDENGARSKSKGGIYITFVNNKKSCYRSDSEGYKHVSDTFIFGSKVEATTYNYRSVQNKTLVYQGCFQYGVHFKYTENFYYFSSDLSIMHDYFAALNRTYEYIRTDGPEDDFDDKIPVF